MLKKKRLKQDLANDYGKLKEDSFNFDLIERYFRKKEQSGAYQVLSDKTCNDLDLNEVFMFVDRTTSRVGQQFLYNRLRVIPKVDDASGIDEKMVEALHRDPELRLKIQALLSELGNTDAFYIPSLFLDEHLEEPKWFFIVKLLSFTSFLSLVLIPFNPAISLVFLAVYLINIGIHYWNKRNLNQYLGTIPQLLRLTKVARELLKIDLFKSLGKEIPESLSVLNKIRNRMSFFKLEVAMEGDVQVLFWAILELFKALFLIEPLLLFGVLRRLDTRRKEIDRVFTFVGYIDTLLSVDSLRQGLETYCIPDIRENSVYLEGVQFYHPLIIGCVPNNISVNKKSILLTGSNMSGKTSFIRTIGINVITALTLNTCFAEKFALPRMKIFSAIRISDDLMNNKSYYFEEVLTIKEMLKACEGDRTHLFLLDEIFKGTNTIERISAGYAVLSHFARKHNLVFVSTHDIELTELLQEDYALYHFSEIIDDKKIAFDFQLKEGRLKNRNAIRILQINEYPEEIILEAMRQAQELDKMAGQRLDSGTGR